jgi:hypothetical protein
MYLDYFDDIIYFKCDSTSIISTTSTTSSTSRVTPPRPPRLLLLLHANLLSRTPAKRGWGCTGELVHHHCPVLVREFEDIAASIELHWRTSTSSLSGARERV